MLINFTFSDPSESEENENQGNLPTRSPKRKNHFLTFILVIGIILAVILGTLKLADCLSNENNKDGATKLLHRTARVSDITVEEKEISFNPIGAKYSIMPSVDIDDLRIKVSVYNSSKTITSEKTLNLGNVKKSVEITFVYSLSDLNISFSNLISWLSDDFYWSYEVIGGTVSYFG